MSQFSKTLTELARARGRSVYDLAKYSQLTAPYVYRLMTGEKSNPSLVTIAVLTDALFVDEAEWIVSAGWEEPRIDRNCPEYTRAWASLMVAASKDAVAKSKWSRRQRGEAY